MPPAPKKGKLLNHPDASGDTMTIVKVSKDAPVRGTSNAIALAGPVSQSKCRPKPVCVYAAAPAAAAATPPPASTP
jgi:hypothetical protein